MGKKNMNKINGKKKKHKDAKRTLISICRKLQRFLLRLVSLALMIAIYVGVIMGALQCTGIIDFQILNDSGSSSRDKSGMEKIKIRGKFTEINVVDGDSATTAIQESTKKLGLKTAADEVSITSINSIDGITYYRLQQNYKGIPVYGRTFVVSSDNLGNTQSLNSNAIEINNVDTSYKISYKDAETIIKKYFENEFKVRGKNIIVSADYTEIIYTFGIDHPVFAYQFDVMVDNEAYNVFLDVGSQKVIKCYMTDMTEIASGSGVDVDGNRVLFNVEKNSDTLYSLEDIERNIRVYDAKKRKANLGEIFIADSKKNLYRIKEENFVDKDNHIVFVDNEGLKQGNWVIRDENGNILDKNAYCLIDICTKNEKLSPVESDSLFFNERNTVTLMNKAKNIYDFFLSELGRVGFDNNNGSMLLVANNTKEAYTSDKAMNKLVAISFFKQDSELKTELIAHEYMHSVERSISHMVYDGESGAIMEAYSDLFGEIIEDYKDGNLNGSCDWIHHAKKEFGYDHTRNLKDPNKNGNPSRVGEETRNIWQKLLVDKNEVHHCSTIISHAAYIMTTRQGKGIPLTMDELSKLWYRTLLTLPSDCTFSDLREYMIQAAENMGLSKKQVKKVSFAFSMVGIKDDNHLEESEISNNRKQENSESEASAYEIYQNAAKKITDTGAWSEKMDGTVEMKLSSADGKQKSNLKVNIDAGGDVSNYNQDDLSALKVSAYTNIQVGGQKTSFTVNYEDGIAHYQYTEPTTYSADVELASVYFEFSKMTQDMMRDASVKGNIIDFTVNGEQLTELTAELTNMINGVENLQYGDADVEVVLDEETGRINNVIMQFHVSMIYEGYITEADYDINYSFAV